MRTISRLAVLVLLAASTAPAYVDPRYAPPPAFGGGPAAAPYYEPPPAPQHPPSWYYNPYTQGIVPLPQRGGN